LCADSPTADGCHQEEGDNKKAICQHDHSNAMHLTSYVDLLKIIRDTYKACKKDNASLPFSPLFSMREVPLNLEQLLFRL
jgi:hypothetical protein